MQVRALHTEQIHGKLGDDNPTDRAADPCLRLVQHRYDEYSRHHDGRGSPGGQECMCRLIAVIASSRLYTRRGATHRFKLEQIEEAYDVCANQREHVLEVAISP